MVNEGKRSLLLAPECPYPLQGGGPMRTGSLLHYLAGRSAVDLIGFHEEGSAACGRALPGGLCASAAGIALPRHSKTLPAKVARNGVRLLRRRLPLMDRFGGASSRRRLRDLLANRRWDIGIVEHLWCAGYIDELRPRCRAVVLDLHNVESELHRSCAASGPRAERWSHMRFCTLAKEVERKLFPRFDCILVASEDDRARVLALRPKAKTIVYPNAIPFCGDPRRPHEEPPHGDSIAFSGNLEYHPNVQGLDYFRQEVWPLLKERHPALTWRIIGRNAGRIRAWARDDRDIHVTGPIKNAVEELAKSQIAVVPLLAGSGTRVKIIEAWAASCAVVSTPIGAEGLPVRDGENLKIVRSPAGWVKTILALLRDPGAAERLRRNGRATFEEHCSWPSAWKTLDRSFAAMWSKTAC